MLRAWRTGLTLQRPGDEMQQVATFARQFSEPLVIACHLAQLEYRGAEKLPGIGIAQVFERNLDRLRVLLQAREQPDQHLRRVVAGDVGIGLRYFPAEMRDSFILALA